MGADIRSPRIILACIAWRSRLYSFEDPKRCLNESWNLHHRSPYKTQGHSRRLRRAFFGSN
jgi:hypothetical protein